VDLPCRSFDFAATLPFGAISESSPESGFSTAKITRSGAPFQGASGDGSTATSAAFSQAVAREQRTLRLRDRNLREQDFAIKPSDKQSRPPISDDAVAKSKRQSGALDSREPPPSMTAQSTILPKRFG